MIVLAGWLLIALQESGSDCKSCAPLSKSFAVTVSCCACGADETNESLDKVLRTDKTVSSAERKSDRWDVRVDSFRFSLEGILGQRALFRKCPKCNAVPAIGFLARDFLLRIDGADCPPCLKGISDRLQKIPGFRSASIVTKTTPGLSLSVPMIVLSFDREVPLDDVEKRVGEADAKKHRSHPGGPADFASGDAVDRFTVERTEAHVLFLCASCRKNRLFDLIVTK